MWERSWGICLLGRKGAVRGWGLLGYLPFFPPLPLHPFPREWLSMNLYLPGRYPDKGENGPVRLRCSTGLNTIQLEFALGKPLPATGSGPVAGVWWGLASVWSAD